MTDQEKTSELIQLMDALCDPSFAKEDSIIENWIKRLNKVYANGYSDSTAAQRTDRQNRYLRNAGNGKVQNAENCYLLPICRLSRNTADRKRMGILSSRHKTGSCG